MTIMKSSYLKLKMIKIISILLVYKILIQLKFKTGFKSVELPLLDTMLLISIIIFGIILFQSQYFILEDNIKNLLKFNHLWIEKQQRNICLHKLQIQKQLQILVQFTSFYLNQKINIFKLLVNLISTNYVQQIDIVSNILLKDNKISQLSNLQTRFT
ncbi:unnamed protein product [Paramecium pentaurelia]|uniref:Transmembrane protein n=1 Tax=Paramecium pentaurelia TaxID=43138 RepID=A0A8S1VRW1_9CILI|nr:unnamed protein product [Paramecium pentaurelia]